MIQSFAHQLPGSRFIGGVYKSRFGVQVPRFTRGELQHARCNEILRGVDIPVVFASTLRTRPLPNIEPQLIEHVTAFSATLARREPSVHHNQRASVPRTFVRQLPAELSETRIGDMPREPRVLNHAFHVQVFDADNLVRAHESGGQRMQRVAPLIRDLAMRASNTQPLFLAALRSFPPARKTPLLLAQIPKPIGELARILDLLAAAQRRQMREPQIHADHRTGDGQQEDLDRRGEGNVVAPIGFALERDGIGTGQRRQRLGEFTAPSLGKLTTPRAHFASETS